jgi:hypothetical protein
MIDQRKWAYAGAAALTLGVLLIALSCRGG